MFVKLQAPHNCAPITRDGETYEVADDGSIEVPAQHAAALYGHGFLPWVEKIVEEAVDTIEDEFSGMNRIGLFNWAKAHGLSIPARGTTAAAARAACRAHADQAAADAEAAALAADADAPAQGAIDPPLPDGDSGDASALLQSDPSVVVEPLQSGPDAAPAPGADDTSATD